MAASITIGRQVLTVEMLGAEADGLALQRRMPAVCADVVAPALEAALSRFDPGEPTLLVERMAIAVSVDSVDGLAEALARALPAEIEDFLLAHWPVRGAPSVTAPATGGVELRSAAEAADEALIVFLATGRLPWSFRVPAGSTLEQLVRQGWAAGSPDATPSPATRSRLLGVLHAGQARRRLRLQFTTGFALSLLRWVAPARAEALESALRPAATSGVDRPLTDRGPLPASEANVERLLEVVPADDLTRPPPVPSELVRWAASGSPDGRPAASATVLSGRDPAAPGPVDRDRTPPETHPMTRRPPQTTAPAAGRAREPAASTTSAERTSGQPTASARATEHPAASARPAEAPPIELAEGIPVANAGLVLLHPFLTRFLTGLGLVRDDRLLDPGRAICLLHHLATGDLIAPEHEVMLAKALCSLRMDEPVPADVGLTQAETDEADALLRAVIGHWEALRDTSPDGLRHEFLRRDGVLSIDGFGDWVLRVETRTSDILLDQLPWGVSMIGLPWMNRLLRVEWR